MKRKKSKGLVIVTVILGLCIILGAGICIMLYWKQRPQELQPDVQKTAVVKNPDEKEVQDETHESSLTDFTLTTSGNATTQGNATSQGDVVFPNIQKGDKSVEGTDEYICPYSAERLLTEEDMVVLEETIQENFPDGLNLVQMLRNELYARYGYEFDDKNVQSYFEQKSWYQAITDRTKDRDAVYENMTDIEKANDNFLKAREG